MNRPADARAPRTNSGQLRQLPLSSVPEAGPVYVQMLQQNAANCVRARLEMLLRFPYAVQTNGVGLNREMLWHTDAGDVKGVSLYGICPQSG